MNDLKFIKKPLESAFPGYSMNAMVYHKEGQEAYKAGTKFYANPYNTLTEHLMVGVLMWSRMGNRPLYDRAVAAWTAMGKACQRPTELLDLTTTEYQAIRQAMQYYLRAIPQLEVGKLASLFLEAQRKLAA